MVEVWGIILALVTCSGVVKGSGEAAMSPMVASLSLSPMPTAAPSIDCSELMYNLVDCISFLSYGSQETAPDGLCCLGFETLLQVDPDCTCEALTSMGIDFNFSRAAIALPAACGVPPPFSAGCNATSPTDATATAPTPIPSPPPHETPLPFPFPSTSMAHSTSTCFSLAISVLVCSLSYIILA